MSTVHEGLVARGTTLPLASEGLGQPLSNVQAKSSAAAPLKLKVTVVRPVVVRHGEALRTDVGAERCLAETQALSVVTVSAAPTASAPLAMHLPAAMSESAPREDGAEQQRSEAPHGRHHGFRLRFPGFASGSPAAVIQRRDQTGTVAPAGCGATYTSTPVERRPPSSRGRRGRGRQARGWSPTC